MSEDKSEQIAEYITELLLKLLKSEGSWVGMSKAQKDVFDVFIAKKGEKFPDVTGTYYGTLFPEVVHQCDAVGSIEFETTDSGHKRMRILV